MWWEERLWSCSLFSRPIAIFLHLWHKGLPFLKDETRHLSSYDMTLSLLCSSRSPRWNTMLYLTPIKISLPSRRSHNLSNSITGCPAFGLYISGSTLAIYAFTGIKHDQERQKLMENISLPEECECQRKLTWGLLFSSSSIW